MVIGIVTRMMTRDMISSDDFSVQVTRDLDGIGCLIQLHLYKRLMEDNEFEKFKDKASLDLTISLAQVY